jgi:hypothetical protein
MTPARGRILIAALLFCAAARPAGASVSLSAGPAVLRFQDARLRDLYPHPVAVRARAELARIDGVPIGVSASFAWDGAETTHRAFVDDSRTRLRFLPIALHAALPLGLGRGWVGRAGPRAVWTWFREDWEARVPVAGVAASSRGTGTWIGAGALAEIETARYGWGSLRLGLDWTWTSARRTTERGNGKREEEMTGGWDELYLEWSIPAR